MDIERPVNRDGVSLVGLQDARRDDLELGAIAAGSSPEQKRRVRRELDSGAHAVRTHRPTERQDNVAVGSDADLVVYDTNFRGVLSAKAQHTNNDYNGFEGMKIEGRPSIVTVRGKVQVRDGKFIGERGRGRMLKREPIHF